MLVLPTRRLEGYTHLTQFMRKRVVEKISVNHRECIPQNSLICRIADGFHAFARQSSIVLGSPWSFTLAILIIVVWAVTGPAFHFSDTWQLIINTGTTIVTFLMVFLIQNTQNRDAKAVHLKLDELIRAVQGARNSLVDLEALSDEELKTFEKEFQQIRTRAEHVSAARKRQKEETENSSR